MNAGTILYIPVAQAEGGATVTVKGQLYGPTLKLDGTDITTGTAVTIATDSTRYVPLSVEGTGSLYLTGIAIDYAAGSPAATSPTVTWARTASTGPFKPLWMLTTLPKPTD